MSNRGKLQTPLGWRVERALRKLKARFADEWSLADDDSRSLLTSPCRYCGDEPRLPWPGTVVRLDPALFFQPNNCAPACANCATAMGTMCDAEFCARLARGPK